MSESELLLIPKELTPSDSPVVTSSNICIICKKGHGKLYGGDGGRIKLLEAAKILDDKSILDLNPVEFANIKYHSLVCYTNYIRRSNRVKEANEKKRTTSNVLNIIEPQPPTATWSRTSKRRKTTSSSSSSSTNIPLDEKECVICGSKGLYIDRHTGVCTYTFRICTTVRARKLINAAALFQDAVFNRISIYSDEKSIFAADLMTHKQCIKKYIKQYDDHISRILQNIELEVNEDDTTIKYT